MDLNLYAMFRYLFHFFPTFCKLYEWPLPDFQWIMGVRVIFSVLVVYRTNTRPGFIVLHYWKMGTCSFHWHCIWLRWSFRFQVLGLVGSEFSHGDEFPVSLTFHRSITCTCPWKNKSRCRDLIIPRLAFSYSFSEPYDWGYWELYQGNLRIPSPVQWVDSNGGAKCQSAASLTPCKQWQNERDPGKLKPVCQVFQFQET